MPAERCPRCHSGRLFIEREFARHGSEYLWSCLACGHELPVFPRTPLPYVGPVPRAAAQCRDCGTILTTRGARRCGGCNALWQAVPHRQRTATATEGG